MSTTTRNFLLGSVTALVAGLALGAMAYYGGLPGLAARPAGPPELKYLPQGPAIVAYADVASVMRSDFRERMREVIPDDDRDRGRRAFEDATGIDIERDIEAVTACVPAAGSGAAPLVAIRGVFDTGRIEAFARQQGARVDIYQGVRVLVAPDRSRDEARDEEQTARRRRWAAGDEPWPALAFAEPGVLLVGTPAMVRAAIDASRTGQSVTSNADLMTRIARLDPQATAWALGRADVLTGGVRVPQDFVTRLPPVTWFEATGRVNGGIAGTLRLEAGTDEAARNLRDVINGLMALGRLQAQSNPRLQPLLQAVVLGGAGRTVELGFSVPADLIRELGVRSRGEAPGR